MPSVVCAASPPRPAPSANWLPLLASFTDPEPALSLAVDVVGTCFSYDAGAEALRERLGDKLKEAGLSSKLLFYAVRPSTGSPSYLPPLDKQHTPLLREESSTA